MIIDSHAHLGNCRVFGSHVSEQELIGVMDTNGIDTSLVLPFPGADNEPAVHNAIANLAKAFPGRIHGVISINPHIDDQKYNDEVKRCVEELGFVGLKLHPFGHACPVAAPDADKIFEAARKYNLPLILHSGLGAPYACPSMFIPKAMQYPDLKIVIAHAGAYIYTAEAIVAAEICPNVYLETSWCAPHRIKEMIEKFGPERVMLGADIPENVATELTKYRSVGLTPEQLRISTEETAKKVFNLP